MAKPKTFEYEGLPKPKEKEGFGNDFTKLKIEQPQSANERMLEGCHYKDVEEKQSAPERKVKF